MTTTPRTLTPNRERFLRSLMSDLGYDSERQDSELRAAVNAARDLSAWIDELKVQKAEARRIARETRQEDSGRPRTDDPPVGLHILDREGQDPLIVYVQPSQRGFLYAQVMNREVLTPTGRATWDYAGRSLFPQLSLDTMADVRRAMEIGQQFGFCVNCGRVLWADKSVERGIGPVCWKRIGGYRQAAIEAMTADSQVVQHDPAPVVEDKPSRSRTTKVLDDSGDFLAALQVELFDELEPQLPDEAYDENGQMKSEWFDATNAMDREELHDFIRQINKRKREGR